MNIEQARDNMIKQQIRTWNVLSDQVLDSLSLVKRERFVSPDKQALAFAEVELPIGQGQHMFEPKIEARILQALNLRGTESVLEIGAGSGYMAALLAAHAEWVRTVEIDPELARLAQRNLDENAVSNVIVVEADGSAGWPERAPYDVILASGAVQQIPDAWLEQLKPGGRLFAFVGKAPVVQGILLSQLADGSTRREVVFELNDVAALRLRTGQNAAFAL